MKYNKRRKSNSCSYLIKYIDKRKHYIKKFISLFLLLIFSYLLSYFFLFNFQNKAYAINANWQWAKRLGWTNADYGYSITTNVNGNIIVAGTVNGDVDVNGDGDNTDGGAESATGYGLDDILISVFDEDGNWQWAKRLGGSSNDIGRSITTDSNGNIIVVGRIYGNVDINGDGDNTDGGAESQWGISRYDIIIDVFDENGNWQWAKRLEGYADLQANGVTTDSNNRIIITAEVSGDVDLNGDGDYSDGGAESSANHGSIDIIIDVFDENGNWQWAKRLGGTNYDYGYAVTTDSNNRVIFTGRIEGHVDVNGDGDRTDGGAESATFGYQQTDFLISVFAENGNWQWAKRLGGLSSDYGNGVTTDSNNRVLVIGRATDNADVNGDGDRSDGGAESATGYTNSDIIISVFNENGSWQWAKRLGGSSSEEGNSIITDINDNVIITGYIVGDVDVNGDRDRTDGGAESGTGYGFSDILISVFDENGDWQWAKRLGGTNYDYGYSIATDANENIIVAGNITGDADVNGDGDNTDGGAESSTGYGNYDILISFFTEDNTTELSNFSPASGNTTGYKTPTITFDLDKNGDCRASLTDEGYDDMADDTDCSGDGTTSISCTLPDLGEDGIKNIYFACQDTDGIKDTADTNNTISLTLDTTSPTLDGDIYPAEGSYINLEYPIYFEIDKTGTCRISSNDEGFEGMADDTLCFENEGDGYCLVPEDITGGDTTLYIACADIYGNGNTADDNIEVAYNILNFELYVGADEEPDPNDEETLGTNFTEIQLEEDPEDWETLEAYSGDDGNRYTTSLSEEDGGYDSQVYKYYVDNDEIINPKINFSWNGYGEEAIGYDIYAYVWNFNTDKWDLLDSEHCGTDCNLTAEVDVDDYIDENNYVWVWMKADNAITNPIISDLTVFEEDNYSPNVIISYISDIPAVTNLVFDSVSHAEGSVEDYEFDAYDEEIIYDNITEEEEEPQTEHAEIIVEDIYYFLNFDLGGGDTIYYRVISYTQEGGETVSEEYSLTFNFVASCPFIYTYDGSQYNFITDISTNGVLGRRLKREKWYAEPFYEDPAIEAFPYPLGYVYISGDELAVRNDGNGDFYDIKVTAEQNEVEYIDRLNLISVDHSANVDIYPDYRENGQIHTIAKDAPAPVSVIDQTGADVSDLIVANDENYWQSSTEMSPNYLQIKLVDRETTPENLKLVIKRARENSTHRPDVISLNSSREQLLYKNNAGEFVPVPAEYDIFNVSREGVDNTSTHIPNSYGSDTYVIDLSGLSIEDNEIRLNIPDNKRVWDIDWLAVDTNPDEELFVNTLSPYYADLHHRGVSKMIRSNSLNPNMLLMEPDYQQLLDSTTGENGNPLQGYATRYGDVVPLLESADNQFVIMVAGDEISLKFDVPEISGNLERDFVYFNHSYHKPFNSPLGDKIAPLPFNEMTRYPYDETEENYPFDENQEYIDTYNTREINWMAEKVDELVETKMHYGVVENEVLHRSLNTDYINLELVDRDMDAPSDVSVLINSGSGYTKSQNVTLTLSATDNLSGVSQMMISNNSLFTGASWESYTTTKIWTLSDGDGLKTIYVKVSDKEGNISEVESAQITLDTVNNKPIITQIGLVKNIPDKDRVYINYTSTLAMIHGRAESLGKVVFDVEGLGSYSTDVDVDGKFYIAIRLPLGINKLTYRCTDKAGNVSSDRVLVINVDPEYLTRTEDIEEPMEPIDGDDTETEDTPQIDNEDDSENDVDEKDRGKYWVIVGADGEVVRDSVVKIDDKEYKTDSEGYIYTDDEIRDGSIIEIEGDRYTFNMDGRYVRLEEDKVFLDGLKRGSYLYCIVLLIVLSGIVIIMWVIRNKNKPEKTEIN